MVQPHSPQILWKVRELVSFPLALFYIEGDKLPVRAFMEEKKINEEVKIQSLPTPETNLEWLS